MSGRSQPSATRRGPDRPPRTQAHVHAPSLPNHHCVWQEGPDTKSWLEKRGLSECAHAR